LRGKLIDVQGDAYMTVCDAFSSFKSLSIVSTGNRQGDDNNRPILS
jgi:hypothetical protein